MRNRNGTPLAHLHGLPMFLRAPRAAGLWLIGVLITVATAWAFAASYHGLYDWSIHHRWPTALAIGFPLLIDLLIVVPEVILFVAAIDGDTPLHVRVLAWVTLLAFTALSIAGNAYHIASADWPTRAGFGLPPFVLALALGFGLGELKRQSAKYRQVPETVSAAVSAAPPGEYKPPPQRKIMTSLGVGQGKARQFQRLLVSEVKAASNGHGGT